MKNFIENYLNINKYTITYFKNGRNNITCLVNFGSEKIIIQKENISFPENQKFLINTLINNSGNKFNLNLATPYLKDRFIEFEGSHFQIMNNIESTRISDEDFIKNANKNNIESLFIYLAHFHNYSNLLEIPEEKKYIGKTFKSVENLFLQAEKLNSCQSPLDDVFEKIKKIKNTLNIIETGKIEFQSGIIHGDPAFKNFLFNKDIKAISLIDYEKVEYNNFMWDIVDLIRSLLKVEKFDNILLKSCISKYCEIKEIPEIEKKEIKTYLKTIIFHVLLQYFLALFPESGVENKIGDNSDNIKKIERCFGELKKIEKWII